jgi:hypothetical protein
LKILNGKIVLLNYPRYTEQMKDFGVERVKSIINVKETI